MKKDVLQWVEGKKLRWSHDTANSTGAEFVTALTDTLWYIYGHSCTLHSRACSVPQEFQQFSGYNQPDQSKHRWQDAENLSASILDSHSSILNKFAMYPWFTSAPWKPIRVAVCTLAESLAQVC